MAEPGRVLGVGVATLDIVLRVATYPAEDAEVRALDQRRSRGGNVANTLAVLRQLGRPCAFAGTLADDAGAAFIEADLRARGVDIEGVTRVPGAATPTSYISISAASGSRTIVHHRDLPELSAADFARVCLSDCSWVHFEGRNPAQTAQMIARVRRERPDLPISIEIEKPRPGIEALFQTGLQTGVGQSSAAAPVLMIFARAYAAATGEDDPHRFLLDQAGRCDADLLIAPWGAAGAYGLVRGGAPIHVPAQAPAVLVDTLAAGDVFNAAVIDGRLAGLGLPNLLAQANRLAGHGCGQPGLDGLVASAVAAGLIPPPR